jgi:hypothetical protein
MPRVGLSYPPLTANWFQGKRCSFHAPEDGLGIIGYCEGERRIVGGLLVDGS